MSLAAPPICMAHRGARGHAPENTLLAMREGIRLGASWLECDIWRVQHELIVHHDPTLERTTSGHGPLHAHTLEQLRELDAGRGERIPLLREVLQLAQAHDVGVNIELKGAGTGERIAAYLEEVPGARVMLSSFQLPELQASLCDVPHLPHAIISAAPADWLWELVRELELWGVHPRSDAVDAAFMRRAREHGVQVNAWTVNELAEMRRLMALGVDGIITDWPDRFFQALEHANKES